MTFEEWSRNSPWEEEYNKIRLENQLGGSITEFSMELPHQVEKRLNLQVEGIIEQMADLLLQLEIIHEERQKRDLNPIIGFEGIRIIHDANEFLPTQVIFGKFPKEKSKRYQRAYCFSDLEKCEELEEVEPITEKEDEITEDGLSGTPS